MRGEKEGEIKILGDSTTRNATRYFTEKKDGPRGDGKYKFLTTAESPTPKRGAAVKTKKNRERENCHQE